MTRPESHLVTAAGAAPQDASARTAHARAAGQRTRSHALAWLAMGALVMGVWQLSQLQLYNARSDTGYWLGVAGGVLMLLLFAYPLRKRVPALARMGKARHWFVVHMVLGIVGPVAILAHCTFRIGSLNAGVALFSMLVVALSGIAGRFIYLRIHRGLGGQLESYEALRGMLQADADGVRSALRHAPAVQARLRALDHWSARPGDRWGEHLQRLFVLPVLLVRERGRCRREVRQCHAAAADHRGWDATQLAARTRAADRLVRDYTDAVLRLAQLAAYTRLFSLWHVLHVPFVVVMVVCAIVHVIAVHAY